MLSCAAGNPSASAIRADRALVKIAYARVWKSFCDHVRYWLRFSPAPPWQLDDLQPMAPTNCPSWLGETFTSWAELPQTQATTAHNQQRPLRNTFPRLAETATANQFQKPGYNGDPLLRGRKFFHKASRCAIPCAVALVQTEMPKVVRNLSGCEPLRTDKLTKYLSTLNDWAKAGSHRFLGAATANRVVTLVAVLFLGISFSRLGSAEEKSQKREAELVSKENSVDSSRPPGEWRSATVGQELIVHDRLRTG